MSLISVKIIEKPRKQRRCESCYKPIEGRQVRLYGSAEDDPPYVIYQDFGCAKKFINARKIIELYEEQK